MAELTFTLTEQQFFKAQRLHLSFQPRWVKATFAFVGIAGLLILAAGLYYQKTGLTLAGLIYSLFLLLSFGPSARLAGKLAMRLLRPKLLRAFRRAPSLHQQSHVELRDGQLHLQSENGVGTLPWKHIIAWAEDQDSLLLYLQPRLFIIVPKEADPQAHFVTALRARLLDQVGPERR